MYQFMSKILIIDDDEELCELMKEFLTAEGFEIATAHDGESGLERAIGERPDMVVLDVMLPRKNGFDVLRDLRKTETVPVIMLTAKGDDTDRIVGLEIGADDYLAKPFNPRELAARLRAVLRRVKGADERHPDPESLTVGDLEMSLTGRTLRNAEGVVTLTALEFELLHALLREAGRIVKKEDLSMQVLERRLSPFDRSLDMHISNLRKKLGHHPNGEDRIKTIRSVGYIYTIT
jgi:two-component system response regulator CpxR